MEITRNTVYKINEDEMKELIQQYISDEEGSYVLCKDITFHFENDAFYAKAEDEE